jgi:myo-inositol 2-dehydrogenase/D-chiro-inositol 1-dehydrogenase
VIGVGVLGSGYMGRTYAFALAELIRGARLVAVAGGSRAPQLAADYHAELEATLESLIARRDVDVVVIATPHSTHLPLALTAAAAGKHIYLEKPMALTVGDCDRMIAAAARAGVLLSVNKITRHRGAGQTTRRLIDEGAIGDVRMIRGTYLIPGWDVPLDSWHSDPREGTPWLDWGAHGCDVVRWLSGSEAVRAYASFQSYQDAPPPRQSGMVEFVMANGVIAQLWMSYEVPVDGVAELGRYLIVGSRAVIDFNAYGDVRIDRGDGRGWVTEWETPPFQYLAEPYTVNRVKGFADQLQDFLDAIEQGREPAVTGADGRAAIAMVQAAERSSETGQVVPVEPP